ncbi:MAG: 4Fe-4S dicluster domain-containing protein [Candidatus Latescibacteria bacterium]|nr:4Fe-4S dicluster domain-containing protein [Candidatus Latescibacterota bacterium]NIO28401.1 4Fe-4S dicluster domain-containing protein [Candidatus Latescibacterota bacterium]NIO55950.1 4Fe-4S dicluster domain-containing protein [Candidatus Latescibacterota bacterium]NIT01914.1 4Fe-4S dicluster domain-containing protein [Candidatus Latescibacterota bacterium]
MDNAVETVTPFIEVIDEIKKAGGEVYKLCYQCGKCDVVCPWNRVRNFSIRRIIREAAFGLTEIESEEIWRCTTCGICPQQCPRGVKLIELGVSLRRLASEYEVFPASVRSARTARASLVSEGNPLQGERKNRADWANGLSVKTFAEGMEVLYFVGCYFSYDPRLKKVAAATANILKRAGIDFGILGTKENCCGESVRKTGGEQVFTSLARENIKTFIDNGVKKIVVSSPHCYHSFKNEYPEFMVNFEVVHISQYLSELINEGRLEFTKEFAKKVTYHDPCYLGRHNAVYDEPREVLEKVPGLELREMPDSRKDSLCCGGGGGRIWMETPKGERFSDLRLEQANKVGAEVLVTSCPYCIANFDDSRLNLGYEEVLEIKDITEVIQEVI